MTTVFVHTLNGQSGKWLEMAEKSLAHRDARGLGLLGGLEPSDDGCGPLTRLFAEPDVSIARPVAPVWPKIMAIRGLAHVPKVAPAVVARVVADVVDHLARPFTRHPEPCDPVSEVSLPVNSDPSVAVWPLSASERAGAHFPGRLLPKEATGSGVVVQDFASASGSKHVVHLDSGERAPVRHRYRTMSGLQSRVPALGRKIA